jgi:cell wall-associated NlpC family hydrolase
MSSARRAAILAAIFTVVATTGAAGVPALDGPVSAWAAKGGISAVAPPSPQPSLPPTAPPGKAVLVRGHAIPPSDAPPAVQRVIRAANRIRAKPYVWGGGHGGWEARGYDCSGAVSYALHGGGLLDSSLVSGSMMRWGEAGRGRWISIYANAGHAYAVIAGLRWDTSGNTSGTGPRWHLDTTPRAGFAVRHPAGY